LGCAGIVGRRFKVISRAHLAAAAAARADNTVAPAEVAAQAPPDGQRIESLS
jgi:hypothetical protein